MKGPEIFHQNQRSEPKTSDETFGRMKILHLIPIVASGGVEQTRLQLAKHLDSGRFEQRVICQKATPLLTTKFEAAGVPVEEIGGSWSLGDIRSIRRIAGIVNSWKPDIVHGAVFEGITMAAVAARLGGAEKVIVEEIDEPIERSWRGSLLFAALARSADRCVGVSPAVMEYLSDVVPLDEASAVEVLNGIAPRLPAPAQEIEHIRREFGIPDDAFVVGGVGRMKDEHKRYSDLLRASAAAVERMPELRVLLVGDGPDLPMLEDLAEELGISSRVTFAGYRDDVGTMLALMDVFVLASSREAFGLVLVEAMHAGLPVIATRVGGPKRVVVDGETGLFVPPKRPDAIERAVGYLYRHPDLRVKLGEAGRLRAEQEFSAERYASDIEQLYLEIVA